MSEDSTDLRRGPDGLLRCWWATGPDPLVAYHDTEWGRGPRDEAGLFERLSLEAFQSGLSWWVVLQRREALRRAFAHFVPAEVAELTGRDVEHILADPRLIRNRAKVEAVISNARLLLDLHAEGTGLADLTEEAMAATPRGRAAEPRQRTDVPRSSPAALELDRRLRAVGWRFIGPVTAYAYLQAAGWVDDHLVGCHARVSTGDLR